MKQCLFPLIVTILGHLTSLQLRGDEMNTSSSIPPASKSIHEQCLTTLREGLRSEEFWPAMHAAEGLTLTGHGQEAIPVLRARLAEEQDDQRRCGLAR